MTQEQRQALWEKIKQQHPIGAKRWYYQELAEVVGYDDDGRVPYIMINVEDRYRGGIKTLHVTRCQLKMEP